MCRSTVRLRLGLVLVQYVHVLHVQYIRTSSFLPGVVGTGAVLVYPSSNFLSIHVLVPDRVVLSIVLGRWKVPGTSRQYQANYLFVDYFI